MLLIFDSFKVFVLNLFEEGDEFILHFLNRHGGKQDCSYSIRTVLVLIKIDEVFLHCRVRQCTIVAYAMIVIGTAGEVL